MTNKKFIIITLLSVLLVAGNVSFASSSDLLRMDLRKSAGDDSVDVTFYTTGASQNTVVTRKSGNSYVVLLPNVSGNQSVVPSLGGVKDLVTDVKVKNVDDGIGGYTKVTFSTTKPVKFQTSTKKTAPLTKAQQDYKKLIAQNSKFDTDKKAQNFKKSVTPVQAQNPVQKPVLRGSKPVVAQKAAPKNEVKKVVPVQRTAKTEEKKVVKPVQTKVAATTVPVVPVKVQAPQNQISVKTDTPVSVEPKVKPAGQEVSSGVKATKPSQPVADSKTTVPKSDVTQTSTQRRNGLPVVPIAGAITVIGLFVLGGIFNVIAKAAKKNSGKLKAALNEPQSQSVENNKEYYDKIAADKKLNWQQKYKLYSDKQHDDVPVSQEDMSYIAGVQNSGKIVSPLMKEKISNIEHSLSKTPAAMTPPETLSKGVQSEEKSMDSSLEKIKLKSFAKHVNLRETGRNLMFNDGYRIEEPLKEGPYVKLKSSALSVSRRKPAHTGFSISNLIRNNRENINGDKLMTQEQEQYTISTLNDYLKILDEDNSSNSSGSDDKISNLKPEAKRQMASVTNPINKAAVVKSKYVIDGNKSIFITDSDGCSTLMGKIGNDEFVLKNFDKIINKPLQVRLDYGNVYIVKIGRFKCLVDVSENKMGTLLEI